MLNLPPIPVPLSTCTDGTVRIQGTEVLLDEVVAAFEDGAIADEIVNRYPSLRLSDVFLVLSFYLLHRKDVEAYLSRRQRSQPGARMRPKPAA
jgi:uncharacterized protein (DUF433 family)